MRPPRTRQRYVTRLPTRVTYMTEYSEYIYDAQKTLKNALDALILFYRVKYNRNRVFIFNNYYQEDDVAPAHVVSVLRAYDVANFRSPVSIMMY